VIYYIGGDAVLGSYYSKPNKTILYNNFGCNGSETFLRYCPNVEIASEESRELYNHVNVAGVNCLENIPTKDPLASAISDEGSVAGLVIVVLLLMATIIAIIG
jgi:deleted-in-malignant-brain-tumors protein 1